MPQGFPVILIFKLVCTLKKVYDTTAVKNDRSREINKVINLKLLQASERYVFSEGRKHNVGEV